MRLLARHLDRARYRIDVMPCFRKAGMPEQTHRQLAALGIHVDTTPYELSFEDTVAYLARKLARLRSRGLLPERRRHLPGARAAGAPPAADRARRARFRGAGRTEALHRALRRRLRQHPRRGRGAHAGAGAPRRRDPVDGRPRRVRRRGPRADAGRARDRAGRAADRLGRPARPQEARRGLPRGRRAGPCRGSPRPASW